MRDIGDVRGVKAARAELGKRGIDISKCDIRMNHGICRISGVVSTSSGSMIKDLKSEMELIGRVLKQKSEIRDVQIECTYR